MEKTSIKHIVRNTFHFTNLWGSIIPMQFIGVYAMYTITSDAPSWWWIATIIGYVCLKMLGVSAGYHRLFSHKGFTVNLIISSTFSNIFSVLVKNIGLSKSTRG